MIAGARAGLGMLALAGLLWPATVEAQTFKCSMMTVNDVQHEWCKRLVARMESVTNGALKGQAFPAGQLGGTPQQIQGVGLGTIEAFVVAARLPRRHRPALHGADLALSVRQTSTTHYRVLNDPDFIDQFLAIGEPKGYKGLSLMVYGPVGIALRTPLAFARRPQGQEDPHQRDADRAGDDGRVRRSGVPMGLVEALQAAQQGVVDGVQSGAAGDRQFQVLRAHEISRQHAALLHHQHRRW